MDKPQKVPPPTQACTWVATTQVSTPKIKVYEKKTKSSQSPISIPRSSGTCKRHWLYLQKETNNEETESDDPSQFKVVIIKS